MIPFTQNSEQSKLKVYCKNNSVLFRETFICRKTIKKKQGIRIATVGRVVSLSREAATRGQIGVS